MQRPEPIRSAAQQAPLYEVAKRMVRRWALDRNKVAQGRLRQREIIRRTHCTSHAALEQLAVARLPRAADRILVALRRRARNQIPPPKDLGSTPAKRLDLPFQETAQEETTKAGIRPRWLPEALRDRAHGHGEVPPQPNYGYNQVDIMTSLTEPGNAPFTLIYTEDYQLKELRLPNGATQRFTYVTAPDPNDKDNDGNTTAERTSFIETIKAWSASQPTSGTPNLLNLAYDYDRDPANVKDASPLVQRIQDTATSTTTTYDYDQINRLKSATNTGSFSTNYTYTYDLASNITQRIIGSTTTNYAYNEVNELTQINGSPAGAYDENGNLTSLQGQSYAYDQRNRTDEIDPPGAGGPLAFDYADEGQAERLLRGDTTFTDTLLGTTTEDPAGASPTYFTRGEGGQPLGMRTPSGDYYYLSDHLGSPWALTNEQGEGAVRYRYEPYGRLASETPFTTGGPVPYNPILLGGQYLDRSTGLYKQGLRYYDPSVGRWTQKDPLNLFQDPKQGNRYAYAGADPVNNSDPSGQQFSRCINPFGCDEPDDVLEDALNSINCGTVADYFTGVSFVGRGLVGLAVFSPNPLAVGVAGGSIAVGGAVTSYVFRQASDEDVC
jgi:RHS repeat-associated protein